jgi:hypothetical protein
VAILRLWRNCPFNAAGILAVLSLAATVSAQTYPAGPDFLVFSSGEEYAGPVTAVSPTGGFVVGWSWFFDGSWVKAYDRKGQELGTTSLPLGAPNSNRPVHFTPTTEGGFIAVWTVLPEGLMAVEIDRYGSMVGSPFEVTASDAANPRVGRNAAGDIVVVWESSTSDGNDTSGRSIQMRAFSSDGTPYYNRFQVNGNTSGDQIRPDVAVDGFWALVVWQSQS